MKSRQRKFRDTAIGIQFVGPVLVVIIVMILVPIIQAIRMSVTDWYLISPDPARPFVGGDNFAAVFSMRRFPQVIGATLFYTAVGVIGKMFIGLGTALLLSRRFVGRAIVRGIMMIPWAIPNVVVATVFLIGLHPAYGILNTALVRLGFIPRGFDFFAQPTLALVAVTLIAIWKYFPFVTLMLLASIQGISQDYYDSAAIDGASTWKQIRHITWPLIQPVWGIVLVLQILWTVKEFELVYLITRGGPDYATSIIGIDVYLNAFRFFRMGWASAQGMLLLGFSLIFAVIYFRTLRSQEGR